MPTAEVIKVRINTLKLMFTRFWYTTQICRVADNSFVSSG